MKLKDLLKVMSKDYIKNLYIYKATQTYESINIKTLSRDELRQYYDLYVEEIVPYMNDTCVAVYVQEEKVVKPLYLYDR